MSTSVARSRGTVSVSRYEGSPTSWDAFVAGSPDATHCHLAGWREVLDGVLGRECVYLQALDGAGERQGVLPLVRVKSPIFGHYLVSLPFFLTGGPLGTSPEVCGKLAGEAVAIARASGAKLLELRTQQNPPPGLPVSSRKVTVRLSLPETAEELWNGVFRAKLRSQIRKPQKEGMIVRFGPRELEPFYEVYSRNMRDLGTPVLPRRMFLRLPEVFGDEVVCGVVYHQGRPVAAGCGFLWRGEYEMTWASSLREFNRLAPNMLLYWSFMEEVIGRGARVFSFGRSSPDASTVPFKLQWGGTCEPLPWAFWSPTGESSTPTPGQGRYALAVQGWQRLPMPIANRLGPVLARLLP